MSTTMQIRLEDEVEDSLDNPGARRQLQVAYQRQTVTAPRPADPDTPPTAWQRLDLFLARLRPHREPLSLLTDALVVAACWNITYLFRLGFNR